MKTQNANPTKARRRPTELTVQAVEVLIRIFGELRRRGHPRCLKGKVSPSVAADILCAELRTWPPERIASLLMPLSPPQIERGKYALRLQLSASDARPHRIDKRFVFRHDFWVLSVIDHPDIDLDAVAQSATAILSPLSNSRIEP